MKTKEEEKKKPKELQGTKRNDPKYAISNYVIPF